MVEFFIVSKCPMEGLYKNEKLARQVSASYQEAVIKRFEAPEEIPAAQKYCAADRARAQEAAERAAMDPAAEEAAVVSGVVEEKKPSNLPVIRKNTVPAKPYHNPQMQLPQWASTVIFTDGSVMPMPDGDDKERMVGGYAALLVFRSMNETEVMISGHKEYPREPAYMEMVAIYKALKRLKKYRTDGKIALFSDCMEVVNAFNSKLTGWHECGYKLKNGGRVKYWKLWKKIWPCQKQMEQSV